MRKTFTQALTRQDLYTGLICILLGTVGLLDITYGNWRPGPGIGPHAFPQIAYITLICAGLVIWVDVLRGKSDQRPQRLGAILGAGIALVVIGMGMFWLIGKLGFAVTVAATLIGASCILTREPLRHWPSTIAVPLVSTAVIWLLFVYLINIPLPRGLLF